MKQKIVIKNFGPINNVELEINDYMFFIGPQASGKSTISKSIIFFKSLKDDLLRFLVNIAESSDFEKPLGSFGKVIRHKFLDFWGPSFHLENIFIKYFFNDDIWISIKLEEYNKYITPTFSPEFREKFHELVDFTKSYSQKTKKRDKTFFSAKDLFEIESLRRSFITSSESRIEQIFNDPKEILFIPAGRSLIATLSEQLQLFDPKKLDFLMRAFIDKISNSKEIFNKSLRDIPKEITLLTKKSVDKDLASIAEDIVNKILKGRYQFDKDGEKIFFTEDKYTKLAFSSSGQQESIWILLLIFLYIVEGRSIFLVIEEPEAHLYPLAQKYITELISLLANSNSNQIIVTTHSPYILTSLNNLIYAHNIGSKNPQKVNSIIKKELWVDLKKISAFKMTDGKIISLIDKDLKLIRAEEIDVASRIINLEFDKLFDLEK